MAILDDINSQLVEALKAKDEIRTSTLRMVIASAQNAQIAKGGELTDAEVVDVIAKGAKQRKESIDSFQKANRQDLADKEAKELEILNRFLPEQLGEEEISKLVIDAISTSGASGAADMGKVMGILAPQIKGRADGSLVSSMVRSKLGVNGQS